MQHVVLTEYHFPERRECLDVKSSTSFRCSEGESLKQLGLRIAFLVLGSVVALAHAGYGGVVAPPTISKAFGAATIPLNGTTTLTFTYTNPNAGTALTGVSFTDTLPSGLIFPPPDGFTGNCSGTEMFIGTDTVSLTGGTVPAGGSCFLTVGAVKGTTAGVKNNTSGNITSTNGGTGNTASASITVLGLSPPTISKAFGAATIPLNGTTTLTFTYTNPNPFTDLTGVSFTDTLPSGLIFPPPDGFTGNCSGTEMFVGTDTVSLTGGTVPANGSCFLTVGAVEGTTAGVKNNTSGNITSTNGGTGNTASASITVIGPTNTPTNTPTITPTSTPTGTPTPIPVVPTLNESGMLVFGLLIAAAGLLLLVRRH